MKEHIAAVDLDMSARHEDHRSSDHGVEETLVYAASNKLIKGKNDAALQSDVELKTLTSKTPSNPMGKSRKKDKKKKDDDVSMDVSTDNKAGKSVQAMDTSDGNMTSASLATARSKTMKSVPMKRAKNLRKRRALERAICNSEKSEEKVSKSVEKKLRAHSAKSLYD